MRTIWKYELTFSFDEIEIEIPYGFKILTVQNQHDKLVMWCEVQSNLKPKKVKFRVIGTGHPIGNNENLSYIGSAQFDHGRLVFHVFRVV